MKIKTVIFAPSLQQQRDTARSEKSSKTKTTPKQAMIKGKKPENKQKVGIITSELVKKPLREEKRKRERKGKKISRASAST